MVLAAGLERDVAQDHDVVIAADLLEGPAAGSRPGPARSPRTIPRRPASHGPAYRRALPAPDPPRPSGSGCEPPARPPRGSGALLLDLNLRKRPVHLSLQTASSGIG